MKQIRNKFISAVRLHLIRAGVVTVEGTESFYLNLSNPTNATIADSQGIGTITQYIAPPFYMNLSNPVNATISDSQGIALAPFTRGGTFTPTVTVSRSTLKEGGHVFFDASATASAFATDPKYQIKFVWDFGDEAGTYWSNGRNLLQSRNVAYGMEAAHQFLTPGTKTVTLTCTDPNGNTGMWTGTITVTEFATADKYYVSNGSTPVPGVTNGVPADAVVGNCYNETTWTGVKSRFGANKCVFLDNSSSWTLNGSYTATNGCTIKGFGTGTGWTLVSPSGVYPAFDLGNVSDFRVMGGKHTGTGTTDNSPLVQGAGTPSHVTISNMESNATYALVNTGGVPTYFGIFDNNVHDLGALGPSTGAAGIYMEKVSGLAIIGNKIDNIHTSHCCRIAGTERAIIANNQFSHPYLAAAHCLTVRGYTPSPVDVFADHYTENVVICDNYLWSELATGYTMHIAPQNDGYAERHRDIIVERNYFVSALTSTLHTQVVGGTCTVRNNLFEIDKAFFAVSVVATSDIDNGSPIDTRVYNNTCYKKVMNTSDVFCFLYVNTETNYSVGHSAPTAITGLDVRNNLAYAPNDSNAVFMTIQGLTPSFRATPSNNSSDTQIRTVKPWAATTPATYADFAPATGSYAKDGGSTDVWVFEDLLGAAITGTRDIGAIQA